MPSKTNKKTKPKAAKAKPKEKSVKSKPAKGGALNHVFVLIIMILTTVIILMLNNRPGNIFDRISDEKSGNKISKQDEPPATTKKIADKIEPGESGDSDIQKTQPEKKLIKVYFITINDKTEKMQLSPVSREISADVPVENAIKELIKGPTSSEKKSGVLTAMPDNLKLRKAMVKNGIAELDFNSAIESGSGTDILLSRIDQIVWTATQFDNVSGVILKINGKAKKTFGNEGLSISGPLTRKR